MKADFAVGLEALEFSSQGVLLQGCLFFPLHPEATEGGGAQQAASQPLDPDGETEQAAKAAAGDGPSALILCHGALEHQGNWEAYARRLAANGYPTLTFDFSGHGRSQGLRGAVQMAAWAYNLRDAMNMLARRGFRRFGLVGWNSGGSAALLAASHDPRVACLVTLATPVRLLPSLADRLVYGGAALVSRLFRLVLRRPFTVSRLPELPEIEMALDPQANASYFSDPLIQSAYASVPVSESLDSVWLDITASLGRVHSPVLVLHGDQDRVLPAAHSQRLYDHLPGPAQLQIIEDSGHALHLDSNSDEVFLHLVRWIKKHLPH